MEVLIFTVVYYNYLRYALMAQSTYFGYILIQSLYGFLVFYLNLKNSFIFSFIEFVLLT